MVVAYQANDNQAQVEGNDTGGIVAELDMHFPMMVEPEGNAVSLMLSLLQGFNSVNEATKEIRLKRWN